MIQFATCANPACGKEFRLFPCMLKRGVGKYCTWDCWLVAKRSERVTVQCARCAKPFEAKPSVLARGAKFCSRDCVNLPKPVVDCICCGVPMVRRHCDIARGRGKFCNIDCRNAFRQGTPRVLACA